MLFSIITITFNASGELPATMASVAEQDFKDFEHLIVDGASTDDTLEVARRLGTPSLRILSERDKGLYDAMNKGLRMARGKYVVFLNAGDAFSRPDVLGLYAQAAEGNPKIIYGDTEIVDSDRKVLGPRHLSAPEKLSFDSFKKGMLVCHQAFVVRRDIAPAYDLSYRFSADYDWTLRCLEKTVPQECVNLHTVAIHYLTAGTTDKNKIASLKERFHIMRRHFGLSSTMAHHAAFFIRAFRRGRL